MLGRADQLRKEYDEEDDKCAQCPDQYIDSQLFSPCHPDVLPFDSAQTLDKKVGDEECQSPHKEDPSLARTGHHNIIDLFQFLFVAFYREFLASVEIPEHIT